ncbi:BNR repeat-like domain-containing protein [Lachnospiraceae bacterium NLAE-zl-G231]|nr:BNR repeat-like domain-containing protein [Lachnospiraceae bacterium NLAE-zl-G231]
MTERSRGKRWNGANMKRKKLGSVSLDLVPGPDNPRNSEGAFLTLENGEILYAYSRYKGDSQADEATADLCLLRSGDDGRTFGEESIILTCEGEGGVNAMSLSLMHMKNGDIGLFYLVRTTYTLLRMFLRRSRDGGRTWGERVLCTPQEGFFVVNNDRVIRLSDGRILIPAAFHRTGRRGDMEEGTRFFDSRAEDVFFYSDDDGVTWETAAGKCSMPYSGSCRSGLQEPGAVELSPGCLWGWARTDLGRQYEMFSLDNGNTWTACQPSRFTSPNGPLSMKRDEKGVLYAVWNPIPQYNGREEPEMIFLGGRTPLVIAASRDNGKTFTEPVSFEEEPDHGYCYCAMHFTKEALLLAYCAGGPEDGICLARTRIRRIPLSQLEEFV